MANRILCNRSMCCKMLCARRSTQLLDGCKQWVDAVSGVHGFEKRGTQVKLHFWKCLEGMILSNWGEVTQRMGSAQVSLPMITKEGKKLKSQPNSTFAIWTTILLTRYAKTLLSEPGASNASVQNTCPIQNIQLEVVTRKPLPPQEICRDKPNLE